MAEKVKPGEIVADVGTDHGYIPVWLVQKQICSRVIASDIKDGPLQTAVRTAKNACVEDKIDFRLCCGLDKYSSDEFDTAIIAGMGGETIISILEAAPWTKSKKLIIQPQSKLPELRRWLFENEYKILDAELVYDTGRIYLVWIVSGGREENDKFSEVLDYQLIEKRDPLLSSYIEGLIKRELKILNGMEKGANVNDAEITFKKELIRELKNIKEDAINGKS
ncbi:MAG: SAM-dependent methyltransferase [Ruminococcaceae bacterium]|nr:SAM-dependent methyltransferase [Oscillospiraceae bacterium]